MSRGIRMLAKLSLLWLGFFVLLSGQALRAEGAGATAVGSNSDSPPGAIAPRLIQFSGALKDAAGQPLIGVQGVTFALYKDQEGGAPLWLETQNVALDEQGRYAVLLGATTSDGLPLELFSSGEARWLGVQLNLPGEPEQPRVLLVSVPYALKAADAETLGGQPLSAFVLASSATKAAVASTSLLADKAGLPVAAFSDGISTAAVINGTVGHLAKFTGPNPDDLGNSGVFEDNTGKVGIGTESPNEKLEVAGGSLLLGNEQGLVARNSAGDKIQTLFNAGPAGKGLIIGRVPPGSNHGGYRTIEVRTLALNRLVIDDIGNVGIGTDNPTEKLEVNGNLKVTGSIGTPNGGITVQSNGISPNIIGGYSGNTVTTNVVGATISGGGESGNTNLVTDNFGTVGGGEGNQAGNGAGSTADARYATVAGGWRNVASGSFYSTVGGGANNTASSYGATVAGGVANTASNLRATVGGGNSNTANGGYSTVSGGLSNHADNDYSTVGGGELNTADGDWTTVGGGRYNTAAESGGTVGGGGENTASVGYSTVSGGFRNIAGGEYSTVGGGWTNIASGRYATVVGGLDNIASGDYSVVVGGARNRAMDVYGFAAGRHALAIHPGTFVWGDSTDANITSNAANEFTARAVGGVRFFTNSGLTTGCSLAAGGGAWSCTSDRNEKEHFVAVEGQELLKRLDAVPVETWNYRSQDASIRHMGPMAQDFRAAFGLGEDDKHISTVDADGVALAGVQALYRMVGQIVQEKDTQIEQLTEQIRQLQSEVQELKAPLPVQMSSTRGIEGK